VLPPSTSSHQLKLRRPHGNREACSLELAVWRKWNEVNIAETPCASDIANSLIMILTDRRLSVFWEVIKKRCSKHFHFPVNAAHPDHCTSVLRDTTFVSHSRG
jgi:hypothetical protein